MRTHASVDITCTYWCTHWLQMLMSVNITYGGNFVRINRFVCWQINHQRQHIVQTYVKWHQYIPVTLLNTDPCKKSTSAKQPYNVCRSTSVCTIDLMTCQHQYVCWNMRTNWRMQGGHQQNKMDKRVKVLTTAQYAYHLHTESCSLFQVHALCIALLL
jgi:hypothetical protein